MLHTLGNRWLFACGLVTLASVLWAPEITQAQNTEGFQTVVEPNVTGKEFNTQSNLWVMEVRYKPLRMLWVETTDPKTGQKNRELIWYLTYKAVNRTLQERDSATGRPTPANNYDPVPTPLFVPEFTLVTNDNNDQQIYHDVVIPEAQAAINRREDRSFQNAVEVVGPIPPPADEESSDEKTIYGVAMWRGVDPQADYFTIYMTGFSNGYQKQPGPNGDVLFGRRTIAQKYWRPGDGIDPDESEIRQSGRPKWIYRPDAAPVAGQQQASPPEEKPASSQSDDTDDGGASQQNPKNNGGTDKNSQGTDQQTGRPGEENADE